VAPRSARADTDVPEDRAPEEVNRVELEGRLSAAAETRTLPSGDEMVTFRVVIKRPPGSRNGATGTGGPTVDTVDCVTWSRSLGKRVLGWPAGSRVAVEGALRRRFWRSGGAVGSRTEVEVERARLVRRPSPTDAMRN
jgi:single-strand DNA-binding protein